jgi:glycine cleavage system regulatory protein
MTVIGPDQPGIVQKIATRVVDKGGNWLESRMGHLGGQFAGILRVEVEKKNEAALIEALRGLEAEGLRVVVHSGGEDGPAAGGLTVRLELVGQDRPGILRQISGVLANHRVNVEELASERVSAPMGDGTLFQARATIRMPEGLDLNSLRTELEKIAADLMVDVKLEP